VDAAADGEEDPLMLLRALPEWMADPKITDICINADGRAWIDRGRGLEAQALESEDPARLAAQLKAWVLDQLSRSGKSWDARHPFVDSPLPPAHRLHAVFPPVGGEGITLSLRRLGRTLDTPAEERWSASGRVYELLRRAVASAETVLVAGSTGSGKTTLVNDLLASVPQQERIIALEDTPELFPRHPHFVALQSRSANADGFGEISIRNLLRQSLRMRPDRIIVGECRGPEVLDLLQVVNTGHRGSLATIHANSARDALRRLEILVLLSAPESLSLAALREWISSGIQWVAHVQREENGLRRIRELVRVQGMESGTILLRPMDTGGIPSRDVV
jgi:pilus assembly protein CpaF